MKINYFFLNLYLFLFLLSFPFQNEVEEISVAKFLKWPFLMKPKD